MKAVVRTLRELGADLVLAPERYLADAGAGEGVPLSSLIGLRSEPGTGLVLDTTHARDGILDVAAAARAAIAPKSSKKAVRAGDVIVSRLRPYLRQVAFVHPAATAQSLAVSSEFYVLAPIGKDSIAFLVPFLLSARVQAVLAAAQEGGHHPRVPKSVLLSLRVPTALVRARAPQSRKVIHALDDLYEASAAWQLLIP
jgi:hypothetical protein